jgi:putative aldouronate transport system permease protein
LFYAVVGAVLSTAITLMAAYPISRSDFSWKRFLTIFFLIPMFFQGGLIPQYILVSSLGLRNTYAVLLLLSGVQVMNLFMACSYFRSTYIPSLYEAAEMDGCTHFGYFFRVLLPISTPIIIVMLLFYGVWQWNDFFRAMIYLDKEQYYPIQLILKDLLAASQVTGSLFELLSEDESAYTEMLKAAESMKYGIIIIATLPMLIIYMCLQKYFIQGITLGSVKG